MRLRRCLLRAAPWLCAAVAAVTLVVIARGRSCIICTATTDGPAKPAPLADVAVNYSSTVCPKSSQLTSLQAGDSWPPVEDPRLRCLSGVVTGVPAGRLGNRVLEYASAWSLARQYGLRLALPEGIVKPVSGLYANLSATLLDTLLWQPPCRGWGLTEMMVLRHAVTDAQLYPVKRYVSWAANHSQPVVLRKWIALTETIAAMSGRLREEFQYKEELARAVADTLSGVRRTMARMAGPKYSKVLLVGMHVRRTDYVSYLRRRYNNNAMRGAGLAYYRRAAARMRQLLQPQGAALAFVVTGDDTRWCDKVLLPALRDEFKVGAPAARAFLVSQGGVRAPAHDLALLSSVDHSVIAYGTFGTWGALMAGGRTIVFDLAAANPGLAPGMSTGAMNFARQLPSWEMLS